MLPRSSSGVFVTAAAGVLLSLVGCGDADSNARTLAAQQVAYDAGIAASKNRDFKTADREFSVAIADSRLSADLQEDAYLRRAYARMELERLDDAKADLDWLQQRATNLDAVWVARGKLLRKHGDQAGASKAFDEARKINPNVVIPPDAK